MIFRDRDGDLWGQTNHGDRLVAIDSIDERIDDTATSTWPWEHIQAEWGPLTFVGPVEITQEVIDAFGYAWTAQDGAENNPFTASCAPGARRRAGLTAALEALGIAVTVPSPDAVEGNQRDGT